MLGPRDHPWCNFTTTLFTSTSRGGQPGVLGRHELRFHAMFCYISPQWNTRRACSPPQMRGRSRTRSTGRPPLQSQSPVLGSPLPSPGHMGRRVRDEHGFYRSTSLETRSRTPFPHLPVAIPSRSTTARPTSSTGLAAPARRSLRQRELPGSCPRCPSSPTTPAPGDGPRARGRARGG